MTREEAIEFIAQSVKSDVDMTKVADAIKALEQEPKWIPVSERLPKEREWYLAVFKEIDTEYQLIPRVADYIGGGENKWRLIDEDGLAQEYRDILECVAWMPLPKPYKPESEEEDDKRRIKRTLFKTSRKL